MKKKKIREWSEGSTIFERAGRKIKKIEVKEENETSVIEMVNIEIKRGRDEIFSIESEKSVKCRREKEI